jgi:hypothetical protein
MKLLDSTKLDRYYSSSTYVYLLGDAKVFVMLKRNAMVKESWK